MKTEIKLTKNELELLTDIETYQGESGFSEYLSTNAKCKKAAGTIRSLQKKDMIYDAYENWEKDDFDGKPYKMWVMTIWGYEALGLEMPD